eukprot:7072931-Pyramimonas_sp.AAC.1
MNLSFLGSMWTPLKVSPILTQQSDSDLEGSTKLTCFLTKGGNLSATLLSSLKFFGSQPINEIALCPDGSRILGATCFWSLLPTLSSLASRSTTAP